MKKSVKLMFLFMAVLLANGCQKKTGAQEQLQVDNNLTSEINIGTVNDITVRVRNRPLLNATIVGQLDKGMTVSVIGRSQNRFGSQDSFWLKIRNDNIEGWVYGAYIDINLTNDQYDLLPVFFIYTESGFIYTENGSFYPDVINGVWDNIKEGVRYIYKGNYSWGENVRSNFVSIDLNSKSRNGPYISINQGTILVQEKELRGNQVILTCYRPANPNERVEIIVTIIDENTISIDAKDWNYLLEGAGRPKDNPNNYFYRIPYDAPYEPLLPGEDM